ncbi:hypothetical protein ACUSIJ_22645 [Pseudochelatococcus sp. B33]
MALDKAGLAAALKTAFAQGMDDPDWTQDDAAQALADAIDAFVRTASVTGITTIVTDAGANVIGHGTQDAPGVVT